MIDRRTLLKTSAAIGTVAAFAKSQNAWALPESDSFFKNMGLQLWTVRNQMAAHPAATLKAVKDAGYAQVELMDSMDSDILVPLAKEHGLEVTSAFINWSSIGEPNPQNVPTVKAIIDKAHKNGLKHLVFGYIGRGHRETADILKATAERANKAAEECLAAGIQLCYHNHSFEFAKLADGGTGFDVLMDRFDKNMKFELDVFWVAIGGWDPIETMKKLDGRISQLHLKDLKANTATNHDEGKVPVDAFQEVGNGTLDFAAIIQLGHKIGVQQCHVEQDQSPNPLESIATSHAFLKKLDA
jgi:sugar phosphate isomerase/epimerase